MRITRCIAARNGLFKNREIDLSNSVTILYGTNGSGKTLLANALIDLLWGITHESNTPELWNDFFLSTSIEADGSNYRIERDANSTFSITEIAEDSEKEIFRDSIINKTAKGCILSLPSSAIKKYLGRFSNESFRALSFMESPLEGAPKLSYEILKDFFVNDRSSFCRAFEFIDKNRCNYITDKILCAESDLKSADKDLQIYELSSSRTKKLIDEKKQLQEDVDALNKKADAIETAKSILRSIMVLESEKNKIESEKTSVCKNIEGEIEKITAFNESRTALEKFFPQFSKFTTMQRNNLERIQSVYLKIRDANNNLEKANDLIHKFTFRFYTKLLISLILSVIIAIMIIAQAIIILDRNSRIIATIACIAAWTIFSGISSYSYRKRKEKVRINSLRNNKEKYESELMSILKENAVTIDGLSANETYEFLLQYFEQYGSFNEHENETLEMQSSIQDDEFFTESKKSIKSYGKRIDEINSIIKEEFSRISDITNIPENTNSNELMYEFEKESAILSEKILNTEEFINKLTVEIEREESLPDFSDLPEKRNQLENRLLKMYSFEKTIGFASELMKETAEQREKTLYEKCSQSALEIFNDLSSKQYQTSLRTDSLKNIMAGDQAGFNASVIHMIYLSIKIALTRFMEDEKTIVPLILDEPTAHMDAARIQKFVEVIKEVSEKRQVIIFTHDKSALNDLGNIVEL